MKHSKSDLRGTTKTVVPVRLIALGNSYVYIKRKEKMKTSSSDN